MVSYELRRAERTNERTATSIAERTPFGVPKVWRSGIAQRSAAFVQVEKPDDHMVRRRSRPRRATAPRKERRAVGPTFSEGTLL